MQAQAPGRSCVPVEVRLLQAQVQVRSRTRSQAQQPQHLQRLRRPRRLLARLTQTLVHKNSQRARQTQVQLLLALLQLPAAARMHNHSLRAALLRTLNCRKTELRRALGPALAPRSLHTLHSQPVQAQAH